MALQNKENSGEILTEDKLKKILNEVLDGVDLGEKFLPMYYRGIHVTSAAQFLELYNERPR